MKLIFKFIRLSVVLIFLSNTSFSANYNGISSGYSSSVIPLSIVGTVSYAPSNVLSIELNNFSGICEEGSVVLKWNAIPKTANCFFIIEQSNDAVNWNTMGMISGGEVSANPFDYSFIDQNVNKGITYYRLKCSEVNGEFKFSEIIDVHNSDKGLIGNFTVYPNPSVGIFNLLFSGDENMVVSIEIFNVFGNKVYSTTNFQQLLDLISNPDGVYFVHFNLKTKSIIKKITKQ